MSIESAVRASDTANMAYHSILPHRSRLQQIILEHLRIFGPSICEEIEERLGMRHSTCSARLGELHAKGLVYTSGERPTSSGRLARLYWVR